VAARNALIEECAQALERAAVEADRKECCGHYRGGDAPDDPPECCGDPDFVISNVAGAAAIRALKS